MKLETYIGECIQKTVSISNENSKSSVLLLHITNDHGGWGRGFVSSLSRKWALPEWVYRNSKKHILGTIEVCHVEQNIFVVNMCAQKGYSKPGQAALDMKALRECLLKVRDLCEVDIEYTYTVTMPHLIGCGLGGGNEDAVIDVINEIFENTQIRVFSFRLV